MKFQFLTENFSRSENAPPFETRKFCHFEVERIFLENKKMLQENFCREGEQGCDLNAAESERIDGISTIIQSTKSDVSASLTEGLESNSSEIQKSSTDK